MSHDTTAPVQTPTDAPATPLPAAPPPAAPAATPGGAAGVAATAPEPAWPPVSVVVPVLNEAKHLRESVHRILGQDYPGELEIVLALGPSKDATDAVAAELAEHDPRVRTVRNPS